MVSNKTCFAKNTLRRHACSTNFFAKRAKVGRLSCSFFYHSSRLPLGWILGKLIYLDISFWATVLTTKITGILSVSSDTICLSTAARPLLFFFCGWGQMFWSWASVSFAGGSWSGEEVDKIKIASSFNAKYVFLCFPGSDLWI